MRNEIFLFTAVVKPYTKETDGENLLQKICNCNLPDVSCVMYCSHDFARECEIERVEDKKDIDLISEF